jgi:FkbM family methyltransferase
LTGVNAFFVKNKYLKNFTIYPIEKIFQPVRYELIDYLNGHKSSLSWLKQVINSDHINNSKNQNLELKTAIANTNYGHMAVYVNDQIIGKSLLDTGAFQESKIKEVLQFLDQNYNFKPSLFVDIGANIGTHSIYAIKNGLFKNAIAFEPDPNNLKLLLKNIAINNISSKVEVYPIALSSISGVLNLELSNTNFGDHRVRPSSPAPVSFGEESERLIKEISALTLDSLDLDAEFSWSNALVWIDTQGHEGEIFSGGKLFLASNRRPPVFVAEFWPYGIERSQSKQKYFAFLAQCKAIYNINDSDWMSGQKITMDQLWASYDDMLALTKKEHHPHTDLMLIL